MEQKRETTFGMIMNNMKKLLFLSFALLASCSANEDVFVEPNTDGSVVLSVEDYVWDEPMTRTNASVSSSGISFTWANGDTIGIYPSFGDVVSFPITAGIDSKTASFNGGAWALKSGYTYSAFYPFKWSNRTNKSLTLDYSGQDGTLANIGNYDYIYAEGVTQTNGSANFTFKHIGAVVRFVVTAASDLDEISIVSNEPIFPAKAKLDLSSGSPDLSIVEHTNNLTIDASLATGETATLYLILPPCDLSAKSFEVCGTIVNGKDFESGKAYSYSVDTPKTTYTINGIEFPIPEAVDLGLPSGTKWANIDIGSSSILQSGYHQLCESGVVTKTPNYIQDVIDNQLIGWSLPSNEQIEELLDNCTLVCEPNNKYSHTDYCNPRYHYFKFVGKNGNYIHIPFSKFDYCGDLDCTIYKSLDNTKYLQLLFNPFDCLRTDAAWSRCSFDIYVDGGVSFKCMFRLVK